MTNLVDTNVLSEKRKRAPDRHVLTWFRQTPGERLYTSVVVFGELRHGIELRRRRDQRAAASLDAWLLRTEGELGDRILPVTSEVADRWGRLGVPNPLGDADELIAATALVHDLTVVTRNTADFDGTAVRTLNPFVP